MVKASSQLKLKAVKAIASIGLFFVVYLVLVVMAAGLTLLCGWLGYQLIIHVSNFYIIIAGIGLISFGLMILLFLIKFIFSWKFSTRPKYVRIYEEHEPELFRMLKEITVKTGTDFPKKVYIAPEMNAFVYYNSSFLSMFFPVKKNLVIGMALINTTTEQELAAILAHEFGHFSQKTMKVGSFVHHVNKIIYNLLYENESFGRFFETISSGSNIFSFFTSLSFRVIRLIQLILQKLFIQLNSANMALSREMEFHADAVAAQVAGASAFERALLRIEYASPVFDHVVSFYQNDTRPRDIYSDHLQLVCFKARQDECKFAGSFPVIPISLVNKMNVSYLKINTELDSHPETEDRISRLKKLNAPDPIDDHKPAIGIFRNENKIKELLLGIIFPTVPENPDYLTSEQFITIQKTRFSVQTLPEIFNGYFYSRVLFEGLDPEEVTIEDDFTAEAPEKLFSDEMIEMARKENLLNNDLSYLNDLDVSTILSVTYEGTRYKPDEIGTLRKKIKKQLEEISAVVAENDLKLTKSIYKLALMHGWEEELKPMIRVFKEFLDHHRIDSAMTVAVSHFIHNTDGDKFNTLVTRIESLEPIFKHAIQSLLNSGNLNEVEPKIIDILKQYISEDRKYIGVTKFYEANINLLVEAVEAFSTLKDAKYRTNNTKLIYMIAGLFCLDETHTLVTK